MRIGWPQILFISTALHVMVGLGFLLSGLPFRQAASPVSEAPALTMHLRSEASLGQTLVTSAASRPAPAARAGGVPVLPSTVRTTSQRTAATAAFALKDTAQPHVRPVSDSVLWPTVPPLVDSRNGIVFILDISGSMYERYGSSTRLELGRELLGQRIRELKDGTPFALVVYAESARRSGPLVSANDATRAAAVHFLDQEYDCGGGTDLPLGLALAGELQMGAILLATDGDLNTTAAELLPKARQILSGAGCAPAFTVVAIGPRPNTDAEQILRELVRQEGGIYQSEQGGDLTASVVAKMSDVGTP